MLWQMYKAKNDFQEILEVNIMEMTYKTKGTCSTQIKLDVENGVIKSVSFVGGCNGNLQGVSRLVEGMKTEEAIEKLEGIRCGFKQTSCPDQLAKALREAAAQE